MDAKPLIQKVIKVMQPFALIVIMFGIQILSFLAAKTDLLNPSRSHQWARHGSLLEVTCLKAIFVLPQHHA